MKNTNKLFGRRITKLILTPVMSIGLVAGFAVTPASADFASYQPYAGEIGVVRTGNAVDGFNLDWSTWIPNARMFDAPASRETLFDSTGIPFAIVACTNESVVITDCLEGAYNNELEPLTNSTFVGIMRDANKSTGTVASGTSLNDVFRSVNVTRSGSAAPLLQWDENPNAVGYFTDRQNNATDRQGNQTPNSTTSSLFTTPLDAAAYKFYVYIAIPNGVLGQVRGAHYEHPYYASAPISVDFRPLSATPTISAQPASASKTVGDALSLSVAAAGAGTLSYQWKKGGTAISGATSATLAIPSVATSDAGSYTVDVINTESNKAPVTVTSNAAVVSVAAAPSASSPSTGTSSTVAPVLTCKIAKGKKLAKACLITASGSVVPKKAKVSLKVAKANKKICKVQGTKIKALKPGTCTVSVKVKPKKGKTITKTTVVTVS